MEDNLCIINVTFSHDGENVQCIGHANGEFQCCDFGGMGEVWRFVPCNDGTPCYFIEGTGGEHGLRLSHANGHVSLSDCAAGGEKWVVIEETGRTHMIKAYGGERDYYLGHEGGEIKLIFKGDTNPENGFWNIDFHNE